MKLGLGIWALDTVARSLKWEGPAISESIGRDVCIYREGAR